VCVCVEVCVCVCVFLCVWFETDSVCGCVWEFCLCDSVFPGFAFLSPVVGESLCPIQISADCFSRLFISD
jgi:hypothetical protein